MHLYELFIKVKGTVTRIGKYTVRYVLQINDQLLLDEKNTEVNNSFLVYRCASHVKSKLTFQFNSIFFIIHDLYTKQSYRQDLAQKRIAISYTQIAIKQKYAVSHSEEPIYIWQILFLATTNF